jgi:hypothetical protein
MKECECERGESERAREGLGSLFKKAGRVACTRPWAAKLNAHWLERAAHGTAGKRQGEATRLRQTVYGHEERSMARGQARGAVSRLGERTPTRRPPGVRRLVGSESTVEGGL